MENAKFQPSFVTTGNPASVNESAALQHLPGQLGCTVEVGNKKWQYVLLDTGAVAAATPGVVAANDVAYWKDRTNYLVTNDERMSEAGVNGVAGVFGCAVTAGYYCFIQRGGRASVYQDTGTAAAGTVGSGSTASTCGLVFTTVGTAPINLPVAVALGAAATNMVSVELLLDPIR